MKNHLPRIWLAMIPVLVIAYFFFDRPICEWIHDRGIPDLLCSICRLGSWPPVTHVGNGHPSLIAQLVEWPPMITGIAPLLLIAASFLSPGRPRHLMILLGISVLVTFVVKNDLKWVFSRYWPLTWIHENPSWISNHAYGFQWFQGSFFQGSDRTGSFPSGHAAVAFAALYSVGIVYRRLMGVAMVVAGLEAVAMVAFDYHFLSDILAGSLVGISCALMTDRLIEGTGAKHGV
jgi:membrane-associated phospholipid phosphatase